jgi:signal transduction histidine kinase
MVRRRPRPIQWLKNHPRSADALLVALAVANVVTIAFTNKATADLPQTRVFRVVVVLSVLSAIGLFWRRRVPAIVLGVAGALVAGVLLANVHETGALVTATIAAYSVGAHVASKKRRLQVAFVASFVLIDLAIVSLFFDNRFTRLAGVLSVAITCGAGFLLGDNLRSRRDRLAYLRERNDYLERTASLEAANAAAAERTRIARELHDIVAHSVSVIAVQAGGARRLVHTRPDTAVEALSTIETTARDTLTELRQLLGVLRSEDSGDVAHEPQPGLDDVERLAATETETALKVDFSIVGERRDVPATVNLAGYRIVQEALTNVRKHAGPAMADVQVRYHADRVEIDVTDNGRGAAAIAPHAPGFGLMGMRERAALCGGNVSTGPRPGGGWAVRATLPTVPSS